MENFPWVGCGVLLVTGLVRLGAKKVNQDLNDLKSCPSMESVRVSDGESVYCYHRGTLNGSPPQVIKVSDRGDFSSHTLLLAKFQTHKITEKMVVEKKTKENEKGGSPNRQQQPPQKKEQERVQKWVKEETLLEESPIKTAKNLLLDGVNVNDFLPILEQRMEVVDTVFKETHDRQVFLDETNNKGNNRSKKADTPAVVINNSNNSGGFSSEGKYAHGAVGEGTKIDKGYKYRLFGVRDGQTYTVVGSFDGKRFSQHPSRFSTLETSSYGTLIQDKENYLTVSKWLVRLGCIGGIGSVLYETRGLWGRKERR